MYILILCLVVGLLIADAVIFFLVGYATAGYKTIKSLKEKGWTIGTAFALLFEFDGDASGIKHVLYNCTATRPPIEGKTAEEEIEPDTETLTISAAALPNGYVKAKTGDETTPTVVSSWFEEVYTPTAS